MIEHGARCHVRHIAADRVEAAQTDRGAKKHFAVAEHHICHHHIGRQGIFARMAHIAVEAHESVARHKPDFIAVSHCTGHNLPTRMCVKMLQLLPYGIHLIEAAAAIYQQPVVDFKEAVDKIGDRPLFTSVAHEAVAVNISRSYTAAGSNPNIGMPVNHLHDVIGRKRCRIILFREENIERNTQVAAQSVGGGNPDITERILRDVVDSEIRQIAARQVGDGRPGRQRHAQHYSGNQNSKNACEIILHNTTG